MHQDIPPLTLALARWTGALPLLAVFAWPHLKRDWGVAPSLAAYFLYNKAVQEIGAADAGQMINFQPLLGAVLAWLFLREPLESHHATGMAQIALGVAGPLLTRMRRG